jgi:hypothetical protein
MANNVAHSVSNPITLLVPAHTRNSTRKQHVTNATNLDTADPHAPTHRNHAHCVMVFTPRASAALFDLRVRKSSFPPPPLPQPLRPRHLCLTPTPQQQPQLQLSLLFHLSLSLPTPMLQQQAVVLTRACQVKLVWGRSERFRMLE